MSGRFSLYQLTSSDSEDIHLNPISRKVYYSQCIQNMKNSAFQTAAWKPRSSCSSAFITGSNFPQDKSYSHSVLNSMSSVQISQLKTNRPSGSSLPCTQSRSQDHLPSMEMVSFDERDCLIFGENLFYLSECCCCGQWELTWFRERGWLVMFPERTGVTLISEEIQVLSPGWDTALHMGLLWFLRQKRKKKGFLDH